MKQTRRPDDRICPKMDISMLTALEPVGDFDGACETIFATFLLAFGRKAEAADRRLPVQEGNSMKAVARACILFATLVAVPAWALDKPKGEPVLTVTGAVSETNDGGNAVFDMDMLEALAGRTAKMETPWTEGQVEFSGPFLREVLKAAGAKGAKLKVKALNDYAAEVPAEDAELDTILATKLNGKAMSVRDKGPLMLVYPFDEDKGLYNEKYFGRSVWQIKEIEVLP